MAFDCLKRLYKEELYSSVVYMGNLLITTMDRRPDFLPPLSRYQTCVYYADALAETNQHRKAETVYMKALSIRKTLSLNVNNRSPATESRKAMSEYTSEAEVKFRLHVCLIKQGKYNEAVGVLETIPEKQRNGKINNALANLCKRLNWVAKSAQHYKDLLACCPYTIEAVVELLNFNVPLEEIQTLLATSNVDLADSLGSDWFPIWLKGQSSLARRDYPSAVSCFRELDTKTTLANNSNILCSLAMAFYYAGEHAKACATLQRVHTLDPLHVEHMDVLASLLAEEKRTKELESLATHFMQSCPESRQSWVSMGYLCRSLKKLPKALYFAHKACGDGKQQPYVEAMLLKGLILMDLKKFSEAGQHFHEALQSNPYRFELYEGLVNCHLERPNKTKEARAAASMCYKNMGQNARSLTLYATVLSKDSTTLNQAQDLLERAVASAPYLLNAVYLLVNIYDRQKQYDKAVDLLKRQTSVIVNSRLHGMLGDFLSKSTLYSEATDNYRFALSLDPADESSLTGLNNMNELCSIGTSTQTTQVGSTTGRSLTGNSSNSTNTTTLTTNGAAIASNQSAVATMTTPEVVITSVSIQSHPPNAPARPARQTVTDRTSAPTISVTTPVDPAPNFMETDMITADITME